MFFMKAKISAIVFQVLSGMHSPICRIERTFAAMSFSTIGMLFSCAISTILFARIPLSFAEINGASAFSGYFKETAKICRFHTAESLNGRENSESVQRLSEKAKVE